MLMLPRLIHLWHKQVQIVLRSILVLTDHTQHLGLQPLWVQPQAQRFRLGYRALPRLHSGEPQEAGEGGLRNHASLQAHVVEQGGERAEAGHRGLLVQDRRQSPYSIQNIIENKKVQPTDYLNMKLTLRTRIPRSAMAMGRKWRMRDLGRGNCAEIIMHLLTVILWPFKL